MSLVSWFQLFLEGTGGPTIKIAFRVLERLGHPFLILPANPACAIQALKLYSPQTKRARLGRIFVRKALGWHLPLPLKQKILELRPQSPFARFIMGLVQWERSGFPDIALMPGNHNAPGRRCVLLVFNENQRPEYVVKFGIKKSSRMLIEKERHFLASLPPDTAGIPRLCGEYHASDADAFVTGFEEGNSPVADERKIAEILTSWIHEDLTISPCALREWGEVVSANPNEPMLKELEESFGQMPIHPVIFHGDFTPWNIKEHPETGKWSVLDWERGEKFGFPGWDWFHFTIETGILIDHASSSTLIKRIRSLFKKPVFREYAAKSNIKGREIQILLGYLFYCKHVIKPTEGATAIDELLKAFLKEYRLSALGGFKNLASNTTAN